MTFLNLQDAVLERLNLTTSEARTRVKRELNLRMAEVTSGTGMEKCRRTTITVPTTAMSAQLVIDNVANVFSIFDPVHLHAVLDEVSLNEIRERDTDQMDHGHPRVYAIHTHLKRSMVFVLYPKPSSVYTLMADALALGAEMVADDDEPPFSEDYHDVLVFGALYDEAMKIEKGGPLIKLFKTDYETRRSDLRYFLAKRAYFSRTQNDRLAEFGMTERRWGPIGVL
jgi:hypothetical protein